MNDAKYIGMDVHQATISAAVRDSRGNLVMEAILETKAETILQFIRGLRGSLYVAFEEGTWAAWLHDLLQPHVALVLASDPRKNALLKAGNKSDRIDARKLSELLYLNKLSPVSRRTGYPHFEGTGTQLHHDHSRFDASDESAEGDLPRLGDSLCRPAGIRTALPCGMALKDFGSRGTPSCRTLLPTVRCVGGIAPGDTTRTPRGSTETSGHGITAADSCDWSHPCRSVDRSDTDAQSLPHQAAAVGLLWISAEDVHQRRISLRRWPTETLQEGPSCPWAQHQP